MQVALVLTSIICAALFWAAAGIWPDVGDKEFLRSLGGIFAIVWAVLMLAMPKLTELTAAEGLTVEERNKLLENIAQARRKIWRIGISSLTCVITLFFLSTIAKAEDKQMVAAFGGFTVGWGFAFLYLAKRWHDELHVFIAQLNERRLTKKAQDDALKRFDNH